MSNLSPLGRKLVNEIRRLASRRRNVYQALMSIANRLESRQGVEIIIPRLIQCEFQSNRGGTTLADLTWFYCRRCGSFINLGEAIRGGHVRNKEVTCPDCGEPVDQAYVYAPFPRSASPHPAGVIVHAFISNSIGSWCRLLRRYKRVKRTDKMRPLASLRYFCPDPREAQQRGCKYLQGNICTDGIVAMRGRGPLRFAPTALTDDITKPLSVAVYEVVGDKKPVKFSPELLPGIEEISLVKSVRVLQVTLCVLVGYPSCPNSFRIHHLFIEDGTIILPSRLLTTSGLVIKVKPEIMEKIEELPGQRRGPMELLHTLSHAFLSRIPILSGLESAEFGEALDIESGEVLIYDNAQGGIGGVEGLVSSRESINSLLMEARTSVECPLECPVACKACLFSDSCNMLNWYLDRHLLKEVMEWD